MVHEAGMRRVQVDQPALPGPQTIIDVVVDDRMGLVEATERDEGVAPGHQASAGHGDDIALRQG
jgi:hypothetical protein